MAWVAEILRKTHRECAVCRLAPISLYDPEEHDITSLEVSAEPTGTPLCHVCLGARLGKDLSEYEGRCLVFEPALGPETYVYSAPPASSLGAAARAALAGLPAPCDDCRAPGRFRWVAVPNDAALWGADWLPALESGELTAGPVLCGRCTGARVARTLEERGLTFEAITPARGASDGCLCAAETVP
jgi:hypothetical protein